MSIEEKFALIGKYVEGRSTEDSDQYEILFTNDSDYTLTLEIEYSVNGYTRDERTDFDSLRWEANAYICPASAGSCDFIEKPDESNPTNDILNGKGFIGWGGNSVRQYDNRGYNAASRSFIVEAKPSEVLSINLVIDEYDEDKRINKKEIRGTEYVTIHDKKIIAKVIGVK